MDRTILTNLLLRNSGIKEETGPSRRIEVGEKSVSGVLIDRKGGGFLILTLEIAGTNRRNFLSLS